MKTLLIIFLCIAAVLAICSVTWAWEQSHPTLAIPVENRRLCVNLVLGLDLTHSMGEERAQAKDIVCESVIPAIGPGDIFTVDAIGPGFSDASNIAGGSYKDQMPEIPEPVVGTLRGILTHSGELVPGMVSEQIHSVARMAAPLWPTVVKRREIWKQEVMNALPPREPGSSFTKFVEASYAQLDDSGTAVKKNKRHRTEYVVVIGDLREEDHHGRPVAIALVPRAQPIADLHVVLVYPRDSKRDWDSICARWREYFKGSEVTILTFANARLAKTLLPPNPLAGLNEIDLRGFWGYISSVLPLDFCILCMALIILACAWQFSKRGGITHWHFAKHTSSVPRS
jgi:hypothetical protein